MKVEKWAGSASPICRRRSARKIGVRLKEEDGGRRREAR